MSSGTRLNADPYGMTTVTAQALSSTNQGSNMSQNKSRLSRRQFIQGGAAAFGIPAIIPGSALGLNGHKAPSERVTMGFIGVGYQARGHLETMKRRDDVQILAVCDVDTTRREDAKKRVDTW